MAIDATDAATDAGGQSFEQVARDDAAFRERELAEEFERAHEAAALVRLVDGESAAALSAACAAINRVEALEAARAAFAPWRGLAPTTLGDALHEVIMVTLEAPHLRPSGIEARLLGGLHAAAFGFFSLLKQLPQPAEAPQPPSATTNADDDATSPPAEVS